MVLRKRSNGCIALVLPLLVLSGCGAGITNPSYVHTLDASNYSGDISAKVNGDTIASSVQWDEENGRRDESDAYKQAAAGNQLLFQVFPSTAGDGEASAVHADLSGGKFYTLVAAGGKADGTAMSPFVVADDPTPPPSGSVKVRVINAAIANGKIDVYLLPATGTGPTQASGKPTWSGVDAGTASPYITIPLPSDGQVILATPAGQPGTTLGFGPIPLEAGHIYSSVATHNYIAPYSFVLALQDDATAEPIAPIHD